MLNIYKVTVPPLSFEAVDEDHATEQFFNALGIESTDPTLNGYIVIEVVAKANWKVD